MGPGANATIVLMTLPNGVTITITEYDGERTVAEQFATTFQTVWMRLPEIPRLILAQHWCKTGLTVLLTDGPPPWRRQKGFASVKPGGGGLCVWSGVLGRIPEPHLQTDLAHELGHMTFMAIDQPGHRRSNAFPEWLVAAAARVGI